MNIKCIAVTKRFLGKLFWYADGLGRNTKHLRPSVLGIWNALMSAMHENYPEHFVVKQEVEAA